MAGGDDPIKRRERARELVSLSNEYLAKAYGTKEPAEVVGYLLDATVRLNQAVKLLIDP